MSTAKPIEDIFTGHNSFLLPLVIKRESKLP
jgi:hypothetical protein